MLCMISIPLVFMYGGAELVSQPDGTVSAVVAGNEITVPEVQDEFTRQMASLTESLGEEVADSIPKEIVYTRSREFLVQQQIDRKALDALLLSRGAVGKMISEDAGFQRDGRFSRELYEEFLESIRASGQSPENVIDSIAWSLIYQQGIRAYQIGAQLPNQLTRPLTSLIAQQRSFSWFYLRPEELAGGFQPQAQAVEDWYNNHRDALVQPERRSIHYIDLSVSALRGTIEVTEADLRMLYEEQLSSASDAVEVRAEAIVLLESESRDTEATAALGQEIQARLAAGESFAELAEQYSDDPDSAAEGGDFGWSNETVYPDEFIEALAGVEDGDSVLLTLPGALAILRLAERKMLEQAGFEELRDELMDSRLQTEAQRKYVRLVAKMEDLSYQYTELTHVAGELGLPVLTSNFFTRSAGSGIANSEKIREQAFDLEDNEMGEPVEFNQDRTVLVSLFEQTEERTLGLDEARSQVTAALRREHSEAALKLALRRAKQWLVEEQRRFTEVAERLKVSWNRATANAEGLQDVPPEVVSLAFELPAPDAQGDISFASRQLPDGSTVVLSLDQLVRPDNLSPVQQSTLEDQLHEQYFDATLYMRSKLLEQQLDVERLADASYDI